jgi:hypothetical protein
MRHKVPPCMPLRAPPGAPGETARPVGVYAEPHKAEFSGLDPPDGRFSMTERLDLADDEKLRRMARRGGLLPLRYPLNLIFNSAAALRIDVMPCVRTSKASF